MKWGEWFCVALMFAAVLVAMCGYADSSSSNGSLPRIGPAPAFALTTQEGNQLSLSDLRGNPVVVTFIFTSCRSACPRLTSKLIGIQRRISKKTDKPNVRFVAISVAPEVDTPDVLKAYAKAHGADLNSWAFLTGTPSAIEDVARRYAVFQKKRAPDDVEHTFLTSLIDAKGVLRVQYQGVEFNEEEFIADLQALAQ
jgi:protein SCO1